MTGKGHAPRQKRDDDAFRRNWEAIFGREKTFSKKHDECKNDKCSFPFCSCEVKDEHQAGS